MLERDATTDEKPMVQNTSLRAMSCSYSELIKHVQEDLPGK